MHQTVRNLLRVLLYTNLPRKVDNAADLIDQALTTAMHYTRVKVTTKINGYTGSLVFGGDMFLDILLIADWKLIQQHR